MAIPPYDQPDSAYQQVLRFQNVPNLILENQKLRNVRIDLWNCPGFTMRNLEIAGYSDVRICGSSYHTVSNVKVKGQNAAWNVFPGPVFNNGVNNTTAWIGDNMTIPEQAAMNWSRVFPGGGEAIDILVPTAHFKAYELNYGENLWKLRDALGKEFFPEMRKRKEEGALTRITLTPRGNMAAGRGFWATYRPERFVKGLLYQDFEIDGHEQMSFYFCDGVKMQRCNFGPSTVDYNLGFENCANVSIWRCNAWGNVTSQGNGADIAFLFGIRKLRISDCAIKTVAITSQGWEVSDVVSDTNIDFHDWDKGWIRDVQVKGQSWVQKLPFVEKVDKPEEKVDISK